ncbi:MAG TPA: pitrilysin family protein [Spirochaetota bacterium]|jgi:predicted Zn-dependent peptidase|nr:MAG: Protease 3 precursor [Spirochaetes bacterium ADurb.Bin218]HON15526.1 pitrilysin family protein [Spirochaetota bacterium]HOQ11520.1 pitrilysin family protein [Spirochaetota bacterium]HOV09867.1 pitrilysin family protein [Spirochaetota bacterium]HRU65409.1 pitrilysin family protein [Spirochaetota bacterium]
MVVKYQSNGITVLLEPVEGVVSVSVGLWINKGSRDEMPEEYGYAHFVEHMLFKGTKKYSSKDIARMVDRVGGQHNAATNREYTCYYISVVRDYLELSLDILSEMYYNPLFDVEEISKEKNVIIEEIRMYEDTPDEFVHDLFMEKILDGHPLSHPILGTIEGIEKITRESILSFYDAIYGNENLIISIAGSFDVDVAKALIDKYFSVERSPLRRQICEAADNPVKLINNHVEKKLEQVHFCLGLPGFKRADTDRWGLYILSTILGGSMSSRLFQNIREKEGISYSIYSFHSSYVDCGVFGIYCATLPDKFYKTVELIVEECRKLYRDGITDEELADTKTFMKGNLALSLESNEVRMTQLARNEMTYGRYFDYNEIVAIIDSITMDDYMRVCHRIFKDKVFSIVSAGKLKKLKGELPDLSL